MPLQKHVNYKIRNTGCIQQNNTTEVCKTLVHSLVTSLLDYGNVLLYGITDTITGRLQQVQTLQHGWLPILESDLTHHTGTAFPPLVTCAIQITVQGIDIYMQGFIWNNCSVFNGARHPISTCTITEIGGKLYMFQIRVL